jgi:hypothetical protein
VNGILGQLARTNLLPDDLATAILAGNIPPLEEIVLAVVIGVLDAGAVTVNDPGSTPTERRIARMVLATAFLSAMVAVGESKESV